jgi:hypothetical protein
MLVPNAHWACVLNVNCVDATVYNPTATMPEAVNEDISYVTYTNSLLSPRWCFDFVKCLRKREN